MFKNYLKIALRNIWKNKTFSFIKVMSLAIGLSASFVIGLMVYHDFSFDGFHKDKERIYRITTEFSTPNGTFYNPGVSVPLAETLENTVAGIEVVAPFYSSYPVSVFNKAIDRKFKQPEHVIFTEGAFFEVFEYQWLAGNQENALSSPHELVLTESRAKKYFPETPMAEIIGKTLVYNDSVLLNVTGIVANFEKRSDIIFKEFIATKTVKTMGGSDVLANPSWNGTSSSSQLFIKTAKNTPIESIQAELDAIEKQHQNPEVLAFGQERRFHPQPLKDLHFNPKYSTFDFRTARASKSTLFNLGCIALFLLLLGCINFINLNTAKATQRAKEIGVRKTLGGSRKQLVFQFLGETMVLTVLAGVVSLVLASQLLRIFSDFIPEGLGFAVFKEPVVVCFIFMLLLLVSLLSGCYPALVLSAFKPTSVLKNQVSNSGKSNTASLRKYLTVFQFAIAQVFIIGTLLVGKQLNYLITEDMGIKTEALANFYTPWQYPSFQKRELLFNEIKKIPGVEMASLGGHPPASNSSNTNNASFFKGENEIQTALRFLNGDKNYLDLYHIDLLAGRKPLNDTIRELVINETYLKQLGFTDPADAIGQLVKLDNDSYPIVGVMQDFNQQSLRATIEPLAFTGDWSRADRSRFHIIHFALNPQKSETWQMTIAAIGAAWKNVYPEADLSVRFMDETIRNFYEQEQRTSLLLKWAAGLSILISCLGLLGLVIYTTERRTKEIGIRKVLGASIAQLNVLLCKDFLKLVCLGFLIAAPLAWYGVTRWLEAFAYKTTMAWWIFIGSGILMALIAFAIMSVNTISKARINPVKSLRTE